ncbi:MAG: hypothetical protein ACKOZW_05250 [Cyanobium sp.]
MTGLAAPALASPLTTLQPLAQRCFASPGIATCGRFFDLSDRLKEEADHRSQLRCYTSLLALEAVASRALRGDNDPGRQERALQDTTRDCP